MYKITNYLKLFDDEITNWLVYEAGFNQSKRQMSAYYKYASDGSKLVMISYVYNYLYWYTSDELSDWFVDTLWKRLHINFLESSYYCISIVI